jgi:hypothetical protein
LGGIGFGGRYVEGLLREIPLLNRLLPPGHEYSSAEFVVWVIVFLALLAADYLSRHRKQ